MRTDAATIPVALISITSPDDWREHAVDEVTFATSQEGRWTAICGAVVMSADLARVGGRICGDGHHRREITQALLNDRQGNAEPRSRVAGRHRVA